MDFLSAQPEPWAAQLNRKQDPWLSITVSGRTLWACKKKNKKTLGLFCSPAQMEGNGIFFFFSSGVLLWKGNSSTLLSSRRGSLSALSTTPLPLRHCCKELVLTCLSDTAYPMSVITFEIALICFCESWRPISHGLMLTIATCSHFRNDVSH